MHGNLDEVVVEGSRDVLPGGLVRKTAKLGILGDKSVLDIPYSEMSMTEKDPKRAAELRRIAEVCRWVPAHAPRDFWEAIQMYWFVHLGTITELNGWDAMNPGHFDQHLAPFYEKGIADGTLTRDQAKELMSCFFIKVNNIC